jgi:hypothetical protein
VFHDGGAGLFGQAAAHRGGIEDDGGAFALAELDQAEGVFDGVQVGGGRAAGHQNEIGEVQGVVGRHVRTAGGVDEDQVGVLRLGLLEQGRELRGRDFDHRRRSGAAALAPFVGGRLRVDIEEGNALAMALGADGEVRGEGAFSGTPLLADQGDGFHGLNFIPSFRYDGKYIILKALSTWIACRQPPRWSVLANTPYFVYCYTLMERQRVKGLRGADEQTRDLRAQSVQSTRRAAVRPSILQFALTGSVSPYNFTVGELCGNHIITGCRGREAPHNHADEPDFARPKLHFIRAR